MKVRGIEPVQVASVWIRKAAGNPGNCEVELHIPESRAGEILDLSELAILHDNDEELLFLGQVRQAEVFPTLGGMRARLSAISQAWAKAEEVKSRFFQKPDKTFADVLERIRIPDCKVECDPDLASLAVPHFLLQQETDIAFICRLARMTGRLLWIVDTSEGMPAIRLAPCLDGAVKTVERARIFELHQLRMRDKKLLRITGRDYLSLGRKVEVEGLEGTFLVTALEGKNHSGRDEFTSELVEFEEQPPALGSCEQAAWILQAVVKSATDPDNMGRLQIRIDPKLAEDSEEQSWLSLITPYAGKKAGFCFLPDEEDRVLALGACGEAYILGALRTEQLEDEFADPAGKYLSDNFGHRLIWKEQALELKDRGNSIIFNEDGLAIKIDKGDMNIKADGAMKQSANKDLTLKSEGGTARLEGNKVELG